MSYQQTAEKWFAFDQLEPELKEQLSAMAKDEKRLEDAFYKDLEFGTGGMRGEIGAGTNRMNTYTVRKASQGVADYVKAAGAEAMKKGIVIAYDSRRKSPEFALEAASTFAKNGIKAYLYEEPRTTPQLSFSVRELGAYMGIVVTASHNPPEYNGYKVYGEDGAQLNLADAEAVISFVQQVGDELAVEAGNVDLLKQTGMIQLVGQELDESYLESVTSIQHHQDLTGKNDLTVVFSPLHGASGSTIRSLMKRAGYDNFTFVEEQMEPNGEFPTLKSPNPEEASAFEMAMTQGKETSADLLITADPDGDRVGVAVQNGDSYLLLTGNQTGAILIEYLLTQLKEAGNMPANGRVFKTIVTSDLGRVIAEYHGSSTEDVLTGFKFIGEKIQQYNETNEFTFLFGYEESYGYLIKPFARDKDAIQTVLAITEAAAFYKMQGKTLLDVLYDLFERHGYYFEGLVSVTKKGADGAREIKNLLTSLRDQPLTEVAGIAISSQEDYLTQTRSFVDGRKDEKLILPQADVLKYFLEDGSWVCVRPSGTEPKIKYYIGVTGPTEADSKKKLDCIKTQFTADMDERFGL
ncbi:phospho-sugar mutase [Paenisporosarcina quisquiliarum]|uniref:Phosphoglucomutase n=1 Tax=Paenisporosarcina quisquiliarum TaxID=365346 RepID=A0A9X3LLL4_9BACL|nr:phospho-sugar mutase [Paenisporosarcina quisquiliarum]MCZ8538579.1 phospho-sugar mutase [Paenisporosarcina quisquiliarum]